MKNKTNVILGIITIAFSVVLTIILFLSVGKSEVASYEGYVIGGLGGFLILENLFIPFIALLAVVIVSSIVLLYRIIKKKIW